LHRLNFNSLITSMLQRYKPSFDFGSWRAIPMDARSWGNLHEHDLQSYHSLDL
jgi:hypothetical protein